jgi:hypothetical protein
MKFEFLKIGICGESETFHPGELFKLKNRKGSSSDFGIKNSMILKGSINADLFFSSFERVVLMTTFRYHA